LPVQVESTQAGAVVANDYSVGVEHWDDFENEVVSQVLCVIIVADQELEYTLGNEAGVTLTRMDSCRDDDSSPNGNVLGPGAEIGDDCHLTIIHGERFADDGLPDAILRLWGT
jgi:hypothetical protein